MRQDLLVGFFHNVLARQQRRILMMKFRADRLAILCDYACDWMDIVIGETFPIASFRKAYADTKSGGTTGKAVIVMD